MTNPLKELSFLALFNSVADAMLLANDEGQVILANASALQLFAYAENEIVGLSVEALIPPTSREHHAQLRNNYFKKPEKRSMGGGKNLVALTQDGRELPVDIGLSPIECDGKNFVLVSFHTSDKRVATEQSLIASEERLRLAKSSAGLGVFDVDLKLNTVRYDALIKQIFDLSPNNRTDYDRFVAAIDAVDQPSWRAVCDHAKKSPDKCEYQIEFRVNNRLNKSQRWLHAAGKVFFINNVAVRMLGVVQDVTDRKSLQQKLSEQRIDLEAMSKTHIAIQTASAIAHEINQPLAAISAYSEVALYALKAENLDTDRLNRSLLGCVTQAQRAGKSLHELMEFLQKGKVESSPIKVLANRTQLQKVLVNLLRNGVEAAHNTGVPVAKIQVLVRTHADLNMAEVIIQDNGPGLTQEVKERIFEPFFTTKSDGIGMGLAISRSLIEACGGQLWFDANGGDGATFHLTLPFAKI